MRYFGKHAKDLNLMEASLLAGLPEAPSYNDPYNNPDAAYARMHYVLGSLVAVGDIKQADADAVDPLVGGGNPTAAQQAQQQANQQALHADLQNGKPSTAGPGAALRAVHPGPAPADLRPDRPASSSRATWWSPPRSTSTSRTWPTPPWPTASPSSRRSGANNGALLMIDAHTGNIEAMVGSADFSNNAIAGQYNVVTASRRPGSSFKPYVYEAGLQERHAQTGHDPAGHAGAVAEARRRHRLRQQVPRARSPRRARWCCRATSPPSRRRTRSGIQNVIDLAYGMGISQTLTPQAPNLSTAIGTSAVRMIDHASAYAAFANGGHKVVASGILKITDGSGNVLRDYTQPRQPR